MGIGSGKRVRGTGGLIDLAALEASLGDSDDEMAVDLSTVLLKAAAKTVKRDADWQAHAQGGQEAGWLADQMRMTDLQPGRISAEACQAAGCSCPVGPSGKTVHMGWVRRPVVKVITKYQDS